MNNHEILIMGSYGYPRETREKQDLFVYNVDTERLKGFKFNENTAALPQTPHFFPCSTRVKPNIFITAEFKSSMILMYNHGERKLACIGNLKEPDNPEVPE